MITKRVVKPVLAVVAVLAAVPLLSACDPPCHVLGAPTADDIRVAEAGRGVEVDVAGSTECELSRPKPGGPWVWVPEVD